MEEGSVAILDQESLKRERGRPEAEIVWAARMGGTSDSLAGVDDAAVENGEGIRKTTEIAAADAEPGVGVSDGASAAASEETKPSKVEPEDDAWKKRRGGSTWGNWNSSKHT